MNNTISNISNPLSNTISNTLNKSISKGGFLRKTMLCNLDLWRLKASTATGSTTTSSDPRGDNRGGFCCCCCCCCLLLLLLLFPLLQFQKLSRCCGGLPNRPAEESSRPRPQRRRSGARVGRRRWEAAPTFAGNEEVAGGFVRVEGQ